MSSLRRILASRANGARSNGPVTAWGKRISCQNATSHGLLARQIVMRDESSEGFEALLGEHIDRLQPDDGVEFGMVEEMVASHWRLRRAWALETRILENETAAQTSADPLDRIAGAFEALAARPALGLMHRYQTRLHLNNQRALHNLLLLRAATVPNEPSPISEHLAVGHAGRSDTQDAPGPLLTEAAPVEATPAAATIAKITIGADPNAGRENG